MYFVIPCMYFRVNLKMKKPTLCCCFTWILFIELNFTVAFLLIRKTQVERFAGTVGGLEIVRNGGNPSNWGDDFEMGKLIPLYGIGVIYFCEKASLRISGIILLECKVP